jgi:peptidoglycan-associated lipoprotein
MKYLILILCVAVCVCGCAGKKGQCPASGSNIDYSDKTLALEKVFFDKRSDKLAKGSDKFIEKNIVVLKAHPELKVILEGHCDTKEVANKKDTALCEKRATIVKDKLVAGGIDAGRLTVKNMGTELPLELSRDDASRAWNRRVEFTRQ